MGAGRKTQTFYASGGDPWPPLTGNGSFISRNLRKSDLGGVIFGCTHSTMQECLSKQLFGLPHGHFSYVRNIGEGLPLFLFNYSDRRLHGIYEAASDGHMSYDAYAWTDGGTERTPFPAQVYIRMKNPCLPLAESQFREVIADNYFSQRHFWFELDHAQTRGLIALFTPSPGSVMLYPIASCRKDQFPALPAKKSASLSRKGLILLPATKWKSTDTKDHVNSEISKPTSDCKLSTGVENVGKATLVRCDNPDVRLATPNKQWGTGVEDWESKGTVSNWVNWAVDDANNLKTSANLNGENQTSQEQPSGQGLEKEEERVLRLLQKLAADSDQLKSSPDNNCSNNNYNNKELISDLKSLSDGGYSPGSDHNYESAENVQTFSHVDNADAEDAQTSSSVDYANAVEVEKSSNSSLNHGNDKLVLVIEELKERTAELEKQRAEQNEGMELLRNAFTNAESTIQLLQDRVKELEYKSVPLLDDSPETFIDPYIGPEDKIYLIGGFDGQSWLSALDCFFPSFNIMTPQKSMSCARSYASAVALDGALFVFGGGDGCLWFDSVEYYDPSHENWTTCSPMQREKGSLAGATLNGKIFAIGGGNGSDSFSDFEMFDPAQQKWINNQSMLSPRFAPAAVELNGVIYALGGYGENAYLRSVERFDPREGTWSEVPNMHVPRACHSVAILQEKLYCMGGYDGEKMVSSLEIFDPRLDCWVMGEPMNSQRGYAAAAVLGNSIISIGGTVNDKLIQDQVECYREGSGWTTTGWNAIGKRCFCSAVVL